MEGGDWDKNTPIVDLPEHQKKRIVKLLCERNVDLYQLAIELRVEEPERFHANNWLTPDASIENVRVCIAGVTRYKTGEITPGDFFEWAKTLPENDCISLIQHGVAWEEEHK